MDIQHHVTCLTRVRHRHRFVICAQFLRRTRVWRLMNRKYMPNSLFERLGPRATNDRPHSILDASEMQTHNLAYSLPCCSLRGACTGCCEPTERVGASNTASRPLHHIYIYCAGPARRHFNVAHPRSFFHSSTSARSSCGVHFDSLQGPSCARRMWNR